MLNIGTGIGVGCYDGHVLRGRYAAGLIAEIEVFVEEVASYRSLDTTVCGRGIRELLGELTGSPQDAVTVFRRAADGDERARTVIDIFSRYLGYTFGLISSFYHPEVIVINGSIKHAAPFYLERAIAEYRSKVGAPFLAQVELSGVEHAAERGTLIPEGGYGAG
jgi:predicted NBD/HSP70 family sugar kinase